MNIFGTTAGKVTATMVALLLAGAVAFYIAKPHTAEPVACTAEAMQCPDGSYVGRTGPNCEFVCPPVATTTQVNAGTTTGGTPGILPYHSGVKGTVMAGPTCPVERNPPDPACADKPLQTSVTVFRAGDTTHAFATTNSDASGAFQVSLPPGEYSVAAGKSMLPRCNQTSVSVGPSGYTSITISCDTGIR